jgi:hypothetical protein
MANGSLSWFAAVDLGEKHQATLHPSRISISPDIFPGYFPRIFSQLPIEFPCSIFPSPHVLTYGGDIPVSGRAHVRALRVEKLPLFGEPRTRRGFCE